MSKFNIGDKVKVNSGIYRGKVGTVHSIGYYDPDDSICGIRGYDVKLENSEKRFPITFIENNLEKIELDPFEQFLQEDYIANNIEENIESFLEMATIPSGFMSIKIAVYGDEGKYPHFHFYKELKPEGGIPKSKRSGGGCICITEPKYFIHSTHKEKLIPKEIKGLIKFLNTPFKNSKEFTNWEMIIELWNMNNPDQPQVDKSIPIPEYKSDMESIKKDD